MSVVVTFGSEPGSPGKKLTVHIVATPASGSPLWDVPNLVITPHCAGRSHGRMRRLTEFFCENLRRFLADEPLLNVVDQQKGYPVPAG